MRLVLGGTPWLSADGTRLSEALAAAVGPSAHRTAWVEVAQATYHVGLHNRVRWEGV